MTVLMSCAAVCHMPWSAVIAHMHCKFTSCGAPAMHKPTVHVYSLDSKLYLQLYHLYQHVRMQYGYIGFAAWL